MIDNPSDRTRDNSEPWQWGKNLHHCIEAARTNTDPAKLTQMAEAVMTGAIGDDGMISDALIENLNLPFPIANRLTEFWRGVDEFGNQLCSRPDATPESLDAWSDHWDIFVLETIVYHPHTGLNTLLKLAKNDNPEIVGMAVWSGRLPAEIVDGYATSAVPQVRAAVAHASRNPDIVKRLVADSDPSVRCCAVANPCTDAVTVISLAVQEQNLDVLIDVIERLTDTELLWKLADRMTGCKHNPIWDPEVVLYDSVAGGAGYCQMIHTRHSMRELLERALNILRCHDNCSHSCRTCLQGYSIRTATNFVSPFTKSRIPQPAGNRMHPATTFGQEPKEVLCGCSGH